MGLYQSLSRLSGSKATPEAPALCGYDLGNKFIAGCLSGDQSGRVHSCEPGVSCPVARGSNTVYITPIVNRTSDRGEIPEVGAGGGLGDLYQVHELELPDKAALAELEQLCLQHIQDKDVLSQMQEAISKAFNSRKKTLSLDLYGVKEEDEISLERLVTKLGQNLSGEEPLGSQSTKTNLPSSIVSLHCLLWYTTYLTSSSAFPTRVIHHTRNYASSSLRLDQRISIHAQLNNLHGAIMCL